MVSCSLLVSSQGNNTTDNCGIVIPGKIAQDMVCAASFPLGSQAWGSPACPRECMPHKYGQAPLEDRVISCCDYQNTHLLETLQEGNPPFLCVSVCMCECRYVCLCVCMCEWAYVSMHMCLSVCMWVYVYEYVYVSVCMYVCLCVCEYICVSVFLCVCECV